IGAFCFVLVVASLVLLVLDWPAIDSPFTAQLPWFLDAVITGVLGLLIASRRPRNPIGWLLLAIAVGNSIFLLAEFTAMRGLLAGASPGGWVAWPAWTSNWLGGVGAGLLCVLVVFFPNGRLPSPRWRWIIRFVIVLFVLVTAGTLVDTGITTLSPRLPDVPSPINVPGFNGGAMGAGAASAFINFAPILLLLVTVAAVVTRFRSATGDERRQLKWFAYVAGAAIAVVLSSYLLPGSIGMNVAGTGFGLGLGVAIPLTVGLAVMKYGLYDIDVFISRTIVYGTLAAFITAVYVGIAVGIGTLVGSGGKPNLGLSIVATAIVAVGFHPVRERVQRVANRLVYGQRATPYEVLSEFSGHVAETYSADEVLPRMARVLRDGTVAESATVWLRSGDQLRAAATDPATSEDPAPLTVVGNALPAIALGDRVVAVDHQGELLGALSVVKRRGESLTPLEIKLVDDLAHQAGLVLKNVGLTDELMQRLEELRTSRQRLVAAQDDERRRLERNLHDGAQQHLVALKVKLGLAQSLAQRDPEKARETVRQLKADADEALETLRDLARGIYPPLLADKGLKAALESQARKSMLPVAIDADGVTRYSQDVEATVYFCVLEALQNVQKYAEAATVVVRLRQDRSQLLFEVEDDGRGFNVANVKRGAGLTNMTDRLDAIDGDLRITSGGSGTKVAGRLRVEVAGVPA
ncbi:MAG TPA: histidine kinase, partial [Candidatus Dormibacteraeota bacterium]